MYNTKRLYDRTFVYPNVWVNTKKKIQTDIGSSVVATIVEIINNKIDCIYHRDMITIPVLKLREIKILLLII